MPSCNALGRGAQLDHSCCRIVTFSSCGTVWVTSIPLSNRERRDSSKLSREGLKWTPPPSRTRSITKIGFLWGLQWEETRKNRDVFWENSTQLHHSGVDTKIAYWIGDESRGKEDCSVQMKVQNAEKPVKTLRPLIWLRRKWQSWPGSPKDITLCWEQEQLYRRTTFSISNIFSKCLLEIISSYLPILHVSSTAWDQLKPVQRLPLITRSLVRASCEWQVFSFSSCFQFLSFRFLIPQRIEILKSILKGEKKNLGTMTAWIWYSSEIPGQILILGFNSRMRGINAHNASWYSSSWVSKRS